MVLERCHGVADRVVDELGLLAEGSHAVASIRVRDPGRLGEPVPRRVPFSLLTFVPSALTKLGGYVPSCLGCGFHVLVGVGLHCER